MEISRDPRAYAKDVFWIIQFDFFPSCLLSFEFLFTTTEIIKHRELTSNISQEASNVVIILQNNSTKNKNYKRPYLIFTRFVLIKMRNTLRLEFSANSKLVCLTLGPHVNLNR